MLSDMGLRVISTDPVAVGRIVIMTIIVSIIASSSVFVNLLGTMVSSC